MVGLDAEVGKYRIVRFFWPALWALISFRHTLEQVASLTLRFDLHFGGVVWNAMAQGCGSVGVFVVEGIQVPDGSGAFNGAPETPIHRGVWPQRFRRERHALAIDGFGG